ncbi:MAG: L,D-transpeptidase [Cyanobacteria bacterium P01_D01_bin.156]
MQGLNPLSRSFAFLCLMAAFGLAIMEWRDPLDWKSANTQPTDTFQNLSNRISSRRLGWFTRVKESDVRVMVELSDRKISVYHHDEIIKQYLVAIGQTEWETPEGSFEVIQKSEYPAWQHPITGEIIPAGRKQNPLGSRWIGFLSSKDGEIGFHGTNEESLIGEAISHGCIRMLNEDVEDLYTYLELGTPVIVKR